MDKLVQKKTLTDYLLYVYRIIAILSVIFLFIPSLNPAHISSLVSETMSLLTAGVARTELISGFIRAINKGWITEGFLNTVFALCAICLVGIFGIGIGACFSLGESKLKKRGLLISIIGAIITTVSMIGAFSMYEVLLSFGQDAKLKPIFPVGSIVIGITGLVLFILSTVIYFMLPKPQAHEIMEMKPKYKLFLMLLPFLALCFVFSYLPLWGWRVTLFDYRAGFALTKERFVGFKWFTYLFQNAATRADMLRVIKNTLAMSGLGLATSWCAMAFAILLCEIKNLKFRRVIQVLTTIPNFISWVLIYTFALALFSTEGFLNTVLIDLHILEAPVQFLQNSDHIWLKMLGWGMWKGLGWSAIIYIAAISSIDQQLFEAATVDGAGRFRKIWHITIPSLLPTYFVLLLLSIAGILSNGMDQYYVFKNAMNKNSIEVLDLYVYVLGLGSGGASNIALGTVVGMMKSIVSVILLFCANQASKWIRGETIV